MAIPRLDPLQQAAKDARPDLPTRGVRPEKLVEGSTVAHAAQHAESGDDPLTPSDIGAALATHDHGLLKHTHNATAAPTVNDDETQGYSVGSHWEDVTNDDAYICADATEGAAVWLDIGAGGGASDPDAIHDNVAAEISAIAEKVTPVNADLVVIEDSADSNNKKKAQVGNLPGGGGVTDHGALTGLLDDDHTQYQKESEKDAASGYAGLTAGTKLNLAQMQEVMAHADLTDAPADAHHAQAHGSAEHSAESDAAAIHDDVAGEINAVTEKVTPVSADLLLIEDSEAANAKKKVQVGNIPVAGELGGTLGSPTVDATHSGSAHHDAATAADSGHTIAGQAISSAAASDILAAHVELATAAEIDTGTDTTRAISIDQFVASNRNIRFITIRLEDPDTDVAVGAIGGDWVCPFAGTLLQSDTDKNWLSANTDTAGTTGTMVVDIHKGGATVMTTNKLDIETGEKSTNTAVTQPDLTTTAVAAGDVFTFEVDAIHTTAAKGLSVTMSFRMT